MKSRVILTCVIFSVAAAAQSKVDVTAGWTYERAAQNSGYANLNGWYASLSYNLISHLGLTAEHESYWGGFNGGSVNQHVWLGGVTWKPGNQDSKVGVFLQPLVGDTRSSSAGIVQNSFTLQLAGGVDIKLSKSISLEFTPAEYVMNYQAGPQSSYASAVGLQFSFGQ